MKQFELEWELRKEMESMFQQNLFNIDNIKSNSELLRFYIGFPNYDVFRIVLSFLVASKLIYRNTEQNDAQKERKSRPKKDIVSGGGIFACIVLLQSWFTWEGFSCKI